MAVQAQRQERTASPARWQAAAQRAVEQGIEVRQVNDNGMWVASSGTQPNVAYLLEIVAGHVVSCSCPAGDFGDPCCKHAARFYLDMGLLEIDEPEPDPPASQSCVWCRGRGRVANDYWQRYEACGACGGTGRYVPAAAPILPAVAVAA